MQNDGDTRKRLEEELRRFGRAALPAMQTLAKQLNGFIAAMLCTLDGLNVCSVGFKSGQVSKMAAVSSSLYAMAKSVIVAFSENEHESMKMVTINGEKFDIIGKKIVLKSGQSLILIIASRETKAGLQQYAAQTIKNEIYEKCQ